MTPIEANLRATGKPYLVVADFIRAGLGSDLTPQGVYLRVAKLTGQDAPEVWGGFIAGKTITFEHDAGIAFALHLEKLWSAKKEAA